jgi:hypothetical protein
VIDLEITLIGDEARTVLLHVRNAADMNSALNVAFGLVRIEGDVLPDKIPGFLHEKGANCLNHAHINARLAETDDTQQYEVFFENCVLYGRKSCINVIE